MCNSFTESKLRVVLTLFIELYLYKNHIIPHLSIHHLKSRQFLEVSLRILERLLSASFELGSRGGPGQVNQEIFIT